MTSDASPQTDIEGRIAAAFDNSAKANDVAQLMDDVEEALVSANLLSDRARDRAFDPTLAATEVVTARREMDDAAFHANRMEAAITALKTRVRGLREQEEQARRRERYEKLRAQRDQLAEELKKIYPTIADQLPPLLSRINANNREIEHMNTTALPKGEERLLEVELVARGLESYEQLYHNIPRITKNARLPAFKCNPSNPYAWPPSD